MKILSWLGVASLILIAAGCASTLNNSRSSRTYDGTDFNGEWRLVDDRSANGRDWLDARNSLSFSDDDWGTSDRDDRTRYGAWFLPDEFRIDADRQTVRIEDESGSPIAEIALGTDYRNADWRDRDDYGPRAHWVDDRSFVVERGGRDRRRITQTFELERRGRRLEVRTRVDRDGGTRSYTRVYERA